MLAPLAQRGPLLNIYTTMARNPDAGQSFLTWGAYVLRRSSIDARLRELAILRVGWRCRSGYEWMQHSRLGLTVGLTQNEIERIKADPPDGNWSGEEQAVLAAADPMVKRTAGDLTGGADIPQIAEDHQKFVAALAAEGIGIAHALPQAAGHGRLIDAELA